MTELSQKSKYLNLITICRKSGKLVLGADPCKENIEKGICFCILVASDASEKTKKEARFITNKYKCAIVETPCTKEDFGQKLGKFSALLGVCDKGFAKAFIKIAE